MSDLGFKFVNIGKSHIHIAYPFNPRLRIWYPGCHRIPVNIFGSVITEYITDAVDEPTKPLCRSCERRTQPFSEAG